MAINAVKMITLKSSDGKEFIVPEAVAMMSQSIRHLIEDNCTDNSIPLANVNSMTLAKVIEYCMKHVSIKEKTVNSSKAKKTEEGCVTDAETPDTMSYEDELKKWDAEFLTIDNDTLYYLILAANFLDIKDLLDLTCQKMADMIKGKSPEKIRETFDIKNDFTPEEEEEIRRDNAWAFE